VEYINLINGSVFFRLLVPVALVVTGLVNGSVSVHAGPQGSLQTLTPVEYEAIKNSGRSAARDFSTSVDITNQNTFDKMKDITGLTDSQAGRQITNGADDSQVRVSAVYEGTIKCNGLRPTFLGGVKVQVTNCLVDGNNIVSSMNVEICDRGQFGALCSNADWMPELLVPNANSSVVMGNNTYVFGIENCNDRWCDIVMSQQYTDSFNGQNLDNQGRDFVQDIGSVEVPCGPGSSAGTTCTSSLIGDINNSVNDPNSKFMEAYNGMKNDVINCRELQQTSLQTGGTMTSCDGNKSINLDNCAIFQECDVPVEVSGQFLETCTSDIPYNVTVCNTTTPEETCSSALNTDRYQCQEILRMDTRVCDVTRPVEVNTCSRTPILTCSDVTPCSGSAVGMSLDSVSSNINWSYGNDRVLRIGESGGNVWNGSCKVIDATINFTIDEVANMRTFTLQNVIWDDHIRIVLNGTQVFIGPNGGDRLEVVSGVDCPLGNGSCVRKSATAYDVCERSTVWNSNPNLNLISLLQDGANELTYRTVVSGSGRGGMAILAEQYCSCDNWRIEWDESQCTEYESLL